MNDRYCIITEQEFVEERLCQMKAHRIRKETARELREKFHRLSGDYNFAIQVGDMIYGVEYFDENVLGNSKQKEELNNCEKKCY